jgi:hypothetical protein
MLKWVYVLWPSFATAAIGEVFFFAFINPKELYLLGEPVSWSPTAVYSVGFLMFWALTALTTWSLLFFLKPADEINHRTKPKISGVSSSHA